MIAFLLILALLAPSPQILQGRPRAADVGGCSDLSGDSNLHGWWPLEETAADGSAKSNDLTVNGWGTGWQNSIFAEGSWASENSNSNGEYFNRTDTNLAAGFPGKNGGSTSAATLGAWVRSNNASGTDNFIGKQASLLLRSVGGTWQCIMNNDADVAAADSSYSTNTWYHVTCRWDDVSDTLTIRVDGSDQSDTGSFTSLDHNVVDFTMAGIAGNDADGYADEGFVFNRSLSDAEVDCVKDESLDNS